MSLESGARLRPHIAQIYAQVVKPASQIRHSGPVS
jgi:hypothetical protein